VKTCLVADDSAVIRLLARRLLEAGGYHVREAADGAEALAACEEEMPDVLLLDWRMPVMNGLDCLSRLRIMPGGDRPKVVFCSVETSRDMIRQALDDLITRLQSACPACHAPGYWVSERLPGLVEQSRTVGAILGKAQDFVVGSHGVGICRAGGGRVCAAVPRECEFRESPVRAAATRPVWPWPKAWITSGDARDVPRQGIPSGMEGRCPSQNFIRSAAMSLGRPGKQLSR
jgi:two-component system chemotaxis response regulator CheY